MIASPFTATWTPILQPKSSPRFRLFCFPFAGGGPAVYRFWPEALPDSVELRVLQLPGRGTRLRESPFTRMEPLVRSIEDDILPLLDCPFAFFGHSLGGLIAFELARALCRRGVLPEHLFVSGIVAPHVPDPNKKIHHLPDDLFLEELKALNGMSEEILEMPELLEIFLPAIRADITVVETYSYAPDAPLPCPLTVFGGTDDPRTNLPNLRDWRIQTAGAFSLTVFDAEHFYLDDRRDEILHAVSSCFVP